jgi:hypothetical protein
MPNVPKYKTGDTWPPLTGTVSDDNGPVNIFVAQSVRIIMKTGTTSVTGPVTVVDDGTLPLRGKWSYKPALNDFSVVGDPQVEIEVTWNATSTPPEIETYPNDAALNPTIHVTADLD